MYQRFKKTILTVCLIVCISLVYGSTFALVGCTAGINQIDSSSGSFPISFPISIPVKQASDKKDAGAFILDVREPEEWLQVRMTESVLIPLAQLKSRLNELPSDREIVVVCRSGNRSIMGLGIIRKAGFEKSSSMVGGLNIWQASGYPTESGPQ